MKNQEYMTYALSLAEKAFSKGEVPVGAVIVFDNKIIGCGYNKREEKQNALCHAEIEAIDEACRNLGSWRLDNCTMYVTLEPCPMCTGAIINSRLSRVVFGAYDKKAGCLGSLCNLADMPFNHKFQIIGGYMEQECQNLLSSFFSCLRSKLNNKNKKLKKIEKKLKKGIDKYFFI